MTEERKLGMGKSGQVTLFVIIAIVIVGMIVLFFAFRGQLFGDNIPEEFRGIYSFYDGCIEQETKGALDILGSQGGRIDIGDYVPGSDYAPFSSHLNFLGFSIPYWYYVSGNNLIKEQLPTLRDMEGEVSEYLESRINNCNFQEFYEQGFYIELGNPKVDVEINEREVRVGVDSTITVLKEDKSARKSNHQIEVQSKMGKYFGIAEDVYNKEVADEFLENYAVDVLYNYAPVDGVEIQCSPKIWKTQEVVDELKTGMQANMGAIKLKGSYYRLDENEDDYFVQDIGRDVDEGVNFVYLGEEFPSKIEVTPASQAVMVAEPIGNQEGLGIMGFCYVPYHFVYDVSFPVLVQISDGFEVFQFPVSVIVDNNMPREADLSKALDTGIETDVCDFSEGNVNVKTFDTNLNAVEADIAYNCFDSYCPLGRTEKSGVDAELDSSIPVCLNGFLIANSDGYAEKKVLFSSNSESFAEIFLDKEYEVEVEVRIAGKKIDIGTGGNTAVVHFVGEDYSSNAILPEVSSVKLKEGLYDVSVYAYGGSRLKLPATRKTECFEVTKGGIAGFFGGTKEECVDVEFPEVNIEQALSGGGKTTVFILESDLQTGKIVIDVSELPKPESVEQLQYNYEVFDTLGVQVSY